MDESYKRKKPLYLISIDFAKAFDSIKRDALMYVLKKYRIHPLIIDVIANIYTQDKTQLYFNNELQNDINITSGIRQGCNGSSNLFLLVTYLIIENLYTCLNGINTSICKIVALFFADDGLILMQTLQEAKESIIRLTSIANECGLSINKNKSNILIFNSKIQPEEIEGIPVTKNITYLGVIIQNKKDCYKQHKIESIKKAKKYSNLMPVVIAKSCNKLLIGKTYWKSAALPSILHGTEAIHLDNNSILELQREENKAYRYILNSRRKTAISALRGEFGASLQTTRDMKSKIFFIKHILEHNKILREIFLQQFEQKETTKWMKQIKLYMYNLKLTLHQIEYYKPHKLRKIVKDFDDHLWRKDLQEKSSLSFYRKYKNNIQDEQNLYDNSESSVILFRARTATLKLNQEKRHTNENPNCEICQEAPIEDIEHFLLDCRALNTTRRHIIGLQQPYKQDRNDIIAEFLLFNITNDDIIYRNRTDLQKLWQQRNAIILQK